MLTKPVRAGPSNIDATGHRGVCAASVHTAHKGPPSSAPQARTVLVSVLPRTIPFKRGQPSPAQPGPARPGPTQPSPPQLTWVKTTTLGWTARSSVINSLRATAGGGRRGGLRGRNVRSGKVCEVACHSQALSRSRRRAGGRAGGRTSRCAALLHSRRQVIHGLLASQQEVV